MNPTRHNESGLRACVALVSALAAALAGCTFLPRGTSALRREAVRAGRPFVEPAARRHLPALSDVPSADELVHRALLNSPDVESAYWQWRAAIEAIPQRGTEATVPALGATVSLKNGAASTAGTMLQLANMSSAPIEWPSKPRAEARAALQRAYAAGWNYRRAQFAVRRETLDAWYTLVTDSAMLTLLHQDATLVRELEAFARAGIQAGRRSPIAALAIENERTGLQAKIAATSARLPADRAALNRILGRPVQRPLRVSPAPEVRADPDASVTRILAEAVRRNPELRALRRDVRAGRIDVARAKLNDVPDFSLSAATSLDGIAQTLGGALMMPFVRYRAINAAIRQSRDRLRQMQARLRSRRLSIAARLVTDLERVRGDRTQIALYERVFLPRLTQLADFARSDVAQNRASADELVQIERTRVRIRELLLELRFDERVSLSDVESLTATNLTGGAH